MFLPSSEILSGQPVNYSHLLNRGLQTWLMAGYHFGGHGSPYWRDISGMHNHGTLTNMSPASDWHGSRGRQGGQGSLSFDGVNDEVRLSRTLSLSGDFTLSAWSYRNNTAALHGLFGDSASSTYIVRWANSATQLTIRTATDVVRNFTISNSANVWGNVVVTRLDGSIRAYFNGVESSTGAIADAGLMSINRIGMSHTASWFSGALDDVRIHDRAWSHQEVKAYSDLSRQGYPGLLNRLRRPMFAEAAAGSSTFPFFFNRYVLSRA